MSEIFNLKPGTKDEINGRIIKIIVYKTDNLIIYIDSNNEIVYRSSDDFESYPDGFSILHSKIRRLEIVNLKSLDKKEQENYNYLLANTLGDFIDDPDLDKYLKVLAEIEKDINEIIKNEQRKSFSLSTIFTSIIIIILILILRFNKQYFINLADKESYEIIFYSLFGGIGALIFNYSKSKTYNLPRILSPIIPYIEGSMRIFYGVIYALIVIIGIKAGLILDYINNQTENQSYFFCFLAIIAGASDKFISAILKSFEKKPDENNNV